MKLYIYFCFSFRKINLFIYLFLLFIQENKYIFIYLFLLFIQENKYIFIYLYLLFIQENKYIFIYLFLLFLQENKYVFIYLFLPFLQEKTDKTRPIAQPGEWMVSCSAFLVGRCRLNILAVVGSAHFFLNSIWDGKIYFRTGTEKKFFETATRLYTRVTLEV